MWPRITESVLVGGLCSIFLLGCDDRTERGNGRVSILGAPDNSGVTVTNTENYTGDETVVTGASGEYGFYVCLPGLITATAPWTVEGQKTWSSRYSNVDYPLLTFTAAGTLSGRATLGGQATGNAGITVNIDGQPTTTNEDGDFVVPKLATGTHTVEVIALGFHEVETTAVITYKNTTVLPPIDLVADN